MARTSKRDWLEAGLRILATQGALALTIERLTTALGLSKGSFYHHFQGLPGYKAALLAFVETEWREQVARAAGHADSPAAGMMRLFDVAVAETPELEIAFRAWALQDEEVREVQARMDRQRYDHIRALCQQLLADDAQALTMSRLAQALMIGGPQFQPPLPLAARRALLDELLRLYDVDTLTAGAHAVAQCSTMQTGQAESELDEEVIHYAQL
ncbi:MAG: TetR/AcrR family transcriptional regulator [Caldilineaceae bacterium]|nr:TetR/AcrR family transcriptional regulator [Caldilineaceae bacterium]